MIKFYSIISLLFIITSCASNTKTASQKNYNDIWIKTVKGKSVVAPNGYLYTFKDNGNVEYKMNGSKSRTGIFVYADTPNTAYYYEKMPLNNIAYDIRDSIPSSNVSMYVMFMISNNKLKMTSGYTKEYKDRLLSWKKNNLTIYNTLREGKDMSEYPIPYIEEVDKANQIEFGSLR
ncbi:hypothetical protein [uncultured Brachyspira sp.]|uniref:hypothetical protein n=2 Tax=uncultured Brachyspira sp. TaxID=221953 RepID=UPI0025E03DF2|nr:hypothetical protein [uncultured Brachyspira sp.]